MQPPRVLGSKSPRRFRGDELMGYVADIAAGGEHDERTETVTYTTVAGSSVATAKAIRTELSYREILVGGPAGLSQTDMVWEVWSASVPTVTPANGDTIAAGGVTWTVLSVSVVSVGATAIKYRCICRKNV